MISKRWIFKQVMRIMPLRYAREHFCYHKLKKSLDNDKIKSLQNRWLKVNKAPITINYFREVFFDDDNKSLVMLCKNNDLDGVNRWYEELYSSQNVYMHYDEYLNHRMSLRVISRFITENFDRKCMILDAACGHGEIDKYLVSKSYYNLFGLDINAERVDSLSSFLNTVRAESIETTTYDDEMFDVLLGLEMLEHVTDLDETIRAFYRVLKPNGILIISTPYKDMIDCKEHVRMFDFDKIAHIFNNYNFSIEGICRLPYLNFDGYNDIVAICKKL